MSSIVRLADYKNDDKIDWDSYKTAQKNNGEICQKCNAYQFPAQGHLAICFDCVSIATDRDEVTHNHLARCPVCRETWRPEEMWLTECTSDSSRDLYCPTCNHEFTVEVHIVSSLTSPPLVEPEGE